MSDVGAINSADEELVRETFDSFAVEALEPIIDKKGALIDVVIPVYRGLKTTLDCLVSVLKTDARARANIVVVDDASPEPSLSDMLDYLAGLGLITLVRNAVNKGFVQTVNSAMANSENDIILLNSDTVVYGNWVERLRGHAYSRESVGSVTPFSDNATLCSYPLIYDDNDIALELSHAQLDSLMALANARQAVEIPTAVGFCMYIRRDCLKEVGLFDADAFGKGYGEENDFCCRALQLGWKHLLAGDVYVRHVGSVSFGHERNELQRIHSQTLRERYPDFLPSVARWSTLDPPSEMRRAVDIARIRAAQPDPILFFCHDLGGGTERHMQEMTEALERAGRSVLFLRPIKTFRTKFFIESPKLFVPNLNAFDFIENVDELVAVLQQLGVKHIHVHSLFDMDLRIVDLLPVIATRLGIEYDVTLHEYLSICPRVFLIDDSGVYCGEPEEGICQLCLEENGSHFGSPSIRRWRQSYNRLLTSARRVFVPSEDVSTRIRKHYPALRPTVRPHEEAGNFVESLSLPAPRKGELLRVAIIGVLAEHKGALLVRDLCADAVDRRLPVEFVLFGEREKNVNFSSVKLVELGPYKEEEIYKLLRANPCHMAFFPAVWPETFSYTLSIAVRSGLQPVAFDIGAIAERVKKMQWGTLFPGTVMNDASFVNDLLLSTVLEPRPANAGDLLKENLYPNVLVDYYEFS
jgi:GT2 family glycosyltransferase/glycosyltransferase involved in cell wall biosynthesis